MGSSYEIEIACDHHEAEEFCAWLNDQGHSATVGSSTGNYVDGVSTDNEDEGAVLESLWHAYCSE